MDTVPGVSRIPTSGRSLHQVCKCSFLPQMLISIFQSLYFNHKLKTPVGAIVAVGTAPFSTGEGKRRRTWLKLECNLIVGTSESSRCSDNLQVLLCQLIRMYPKGVTGVACCCQIRWLHHGAWWARATEITGCCLSWNGLSSRLARLAVPNKSRLVVWLISVPV